MSIIYRANKLKEIAAVQFKEKLATYLDQVKEAEVVLGSHLHFKFADGVEAVSILIGDGEVGDFLHRCEHIVQGKACHHVACAFAVSKILGHDIKRFGIIKQQSDLEPFLAHEFTDINESVGLPKYTEFVEPSTTEDETETDTEETEQPQAAPTPAKPKKPKKKRNPATNWNEVEEFLKEQMVSRQVIQQVKAERNTIFAQTEITDMTSEPTKPETPYMGLMLERAIKHILMGESLLLVGEKGSGKDTLVATLAWVFGLPMYLQTGHRGYTAETLVGDNMPTGNGMEVAFKYTAYATSVMMGGLVHFAELNMLVPDATSVFHSVYDGNNQLSTPYGTVDKHPCHVFIASINVGENYAGIKKLNEALKDRLAVLQMPTNIDFNELITAKSGLTDVHLLSFLKSIKDAIEDVHNNEGIGSEAITLRGYIKAAMYLARFGSNDENLAIAIEDYILNRVDDREDRFTIRQHLRIKCFKNLGFEAGEENFMAM